MFYPIDGFAGLLIVLFMIVYWNHDKRMQKQAIKKAKDQFLAMPETQLYLHKGYEISKITHLGGSEYNFTLTLNPAKDPRNKKNKEKSNNQVKLAS